MKRCGVIGCLVLILGADLACGGESADGLSAERFVHPPASARPWVYWFWVNGNITRAGITADLEAMKRVGIGGVLIMEVDQGAPPGGVPFAGRRWRGLFHHVVTEAHRLGLEVNMNNDAGWCGSGGPWVPPPLSMQKLVWTETHVTGPGRVETTLPRPRAVAGFYRDIGVLAVPELDRQTRIPGVGAKALFKVPQTVLAMPPAWPATESGTTIPPGKVLDLTKHLNSRGRLAWNAPPGEWVVIRFGHTSTGAQNHPAPRSGRGLECDKLNRKAVEVHFAGLMDKLARDAGLLAGRTLVSTHIDSWEVGSQNWTPGFRREFRRRRGYDPLPFLPTMTGRVVGDRDTSERFLWDFRQTVSDLVLDNYAGHLRDLAHRRGLRLSIEAYHTCPVNELAYAGRADEPMGEFWSWGRYGAAFSCTEMASAGHVYGKRIIGAEAFTASSGERWLGHPGKIKDLGDWAFCEGINRFVFHRYALQPWSGYAPGMSMGPWGLHYERTQTWWEQSAAWHEYLSRCQFLLQQGLFVADLCLLAPEGAPLSLVGQRLLSSGTTPGRPLVRSGYNFDVCPAEVVLHRMTVRDGRLVLPDGMSYRVLALPRVSRMTPGLLRKIKELVAAGATIVGTPPVKSPSLADFPTADNEVRRMAAELWGGLHPPGRLAWRRFGKGRVFWGGEFGSAHLLEPLPALSEARWIWYPEGHPEQSAPPGRRCFRRAFVVDLKGKIRSARLVMTADNRFTCWLNGRRVLSGEDWHRTYSTKVAGVVHPGRNVLAVMAENTTDAPTPAGLIGSLRVVSTTGQTLVVGTDGSWRAAKTATPGWPTTAAGGSGWVSAVVLGPNGTDPWGDVEAAATATAVFPQLGALGRLLSRLGVPPDFAYQPPRWPGSVRYLHRTLSQAEVYFVANQDSRPVQLLGSFRVRGRRPELWWPDTGRIERPAVYDVAGGCTRVSLRLDPYGSVFVVFPAQTEVDSNRVTVVYRNGSALLDTHWQAQRETETLSAPDNHAGLTGTFTLAVWARPTADTVLPPEADSGTNALAGPRNDAVYPPPGHEVYSGPRHAGCGLSIGRNGVCVLEHSSDYFSSVLTWATPLTGWTHVAVVYRNGQPSLYLDGRFVHRGLRSTHLVHPGVGVKHGRPVPPFRGDLGGWRLVPRAMSQKEIAELVRSTPRPQTREPVGWLRTLFRADGHVELVTDQPGRYVFVTAGGARHEVFVASVPRPLPVAGPWEVRFPRPGGGYRHLSFPKLQSWSVHPDPEIRYFSGSADYWKVFTLPGGLVRPSRRFVLDLGKVAVTAEVILNGRQLGTLWKAPFQVAATDAVKPGDNLLRVRVTNLWVNRMIGDEHLPEDSDRNPNGTLKRWPSWLLLAEPSPTGRQTFTSWRLWGKDDPLQESGLLGPVRLRVLDVREALPKPAVLRR